MSVASRYGSPDDDTGVNRRPTHRIEEGVALGHDTLAGWTAQMNKEEEQSVLEISLSLETEMGEPIPALQLRLYPPVQQALVKAVDALRQNPEQAYIRITLYGTPEKGVHMDFERDVLLSLAGTIQEEQWGSLGIQ